MTEHWQVIAATLHDPGNPDNGAQENCLVDGPEDEARRVYADTISSADEHGYASVRLTRDGVDVQTWPQATGWTV